MPSKSPIRPMVLKGGLVSFDTQTTGAKPSRIFIFQYNPENIKRTLTSRAPPPPSGNTGAAKEDVMRVLGPPEDKITMTVELDAADQLEEPEKNRVTVEHGLQPVLATLEMLLYPPANSADQIEKLASQGKVQLSPATLPITLLVWGKSRVVPVKLTNFSVTEEAFDTNLNPIVAKVELGMTVLTYMEYPDKNLARDAFIAYQREKENLAKLYSTAGNESGRLTGLLPGK